MKQLAIIVAAAAALAVAAAADARVLDLAGFTAVEASRGVSVEVLQGESYAVRIEGPDADRVRARVRAGELQLSRADWTVFGDSGGVDAEIRVTMPRIARLAASQGATLDAANIRAGSLKLGASQGGQLTVAGVCASLEVRASMGGMVSAERLDCAAAEAAASMGGQVNVRARDSIEARASMGGMVHVAGAPPRAEVSSSLGGMVSID